MVNVFIIGSKGIPAAYGGFETFVDKLVEKKVSSDIKYYVSCLSSNEGVFEYKNALCFNIKVENIGSAKAILYDVKSLITCVKYIRDNNVENPVIYILACRIGPFFAFYKRKLEKMGIKVYINPDGHEWKRSKWNKAIKQYWKLSEKLMVKHADLLICDSLGIENYIKEEYKSYRPKTTFISYGAELELSKLQGDSEALISWYEKHKIKSNNYYLIVGRFVPENNYETMIREFIKSDTEKDLVIITNIEKNKFYNQLLKGTSFTDDKRIKFVGTVYDNELLKKIRQNAYGYIHGHEVGGTNPSLLEALASTKINILLDVVFNREVAADSAIYFNKIEGSLANIINEVEQYDSDKITSLDEESFSRIKLNYSWDKIVSQYEKLFMSK